MLTGIQIEKKLKELIPLLRKKYFVERIGYFGSFTRNEQTNQSDLDLLVSFNKPLGWEFFDLITLLEDELQLKVDLVSEKALKEQLKETILKSIIYI